MAAVTPDRLIEEAHREGVNFMFDGERVGLRGDPDTVARLVPRLRPYKGDLLRILRTRRGWRVFIPGRDPFNLVCVQGCNQLELLARYPDGTTVEPLQ